MPDELVNRSVALNVRLSAEEHIALRRYANKLGLSQAGLIRMLIREAVNQDVMQRLANKARKAGLLREVANPPPEILRDEMRRTWRITRKRQ